MSKVKEILWRILKSEVVWWHLILLLLLDIGVVGKLEKWGYPKLEE